MTYINFHIIAIRIMKHFFFSSNIGLDCRSYLPSSSFLTASNLYELHRYLRNFFVFNDTGIEPTGNLPLSYIPSSPPPPFYCFLFSERVLLSCPGSSYSGEFGITGKCHHDLLYLGKLKLQCSSVISTVEWQKIETLTDSKVQEFFMDPSRSEP